MLVCASDPGRADMSERVDVLEECPGLGDHLYCKYYSHALLSKSLSSEGLNSSVCFCLCAAVSPSKTLMC